MILFNNFNAHIQTIRPELDDAIARVLDSGWFVLGKEVQAFELELADHLGAKHAVGVANGTDAIALALMALDIGPGDEVITTNMTAYPTITGIRQTGATPVVVDVDEATGLLDPTRIPAAISDRTRAILPVHLYGQPCNMDAILALAAEQGLKVVEDCAQAIGAIWKDQTCGTMGDLGCFSFYPSKNLGALGDGGAVTCRDKATFQRLLALRNYGQSVRYFHDETGINSRLDEIQAAILRVKLKHLPAWTERRRAIAAVYHSQLEHVNTLDVSADAGHVYHLFPIKIAGRDEFMAALKEEGIQTLIHYPVPVNQQKDFPHQKDQSFPCTERFAAQIVSLPIAPELSDADVRRIVDVVNKHSR